MVFPSKYAALIVSYAALAVTAQSAWAGSTVSFANDVQPIFDKQCVSCHGPDHPGGPAGDMDLTDGLSYGNLVFQPTSDGCMQEVPDSVRVVAFDTESSMLWLKTLPDDRRCGVPMPWGTDGLGIIAPDEFAIIETWILEGAQDN